MSKLLTCLEVTRGMFTGDLSESRIKKNGLKEMAIEGSGTALTGGHREAQRRFREAKALRKQKVAEAEALKKYQADRRARMVYLDIDGEDLRLMLVNEDLIPEDCESVEWIGKTGSGGIRVLCLK